MTPGFNESDIEIKNDDGRYEIICVCSSNWYLSLQLVHFAWDSGIITDKRWYYFL